MNSMHVCVCVLVSWSVDSTGMWMLVGEGVFVEQIGSECGMAVGVFV